jgi:hypothetical protein
MAVNVGVVGSRADAAQGNVSDCISCRKVVRWKSIIISQKNFITAFFGLRHFSPLMVSNAIAIG